VKQIFFANSFVLQPAAFSFAGIIYSMKSKHQIVLGVNIFELIHHHIHLKPNFAEKKHDSTMHRRFNKLNEFKLHKKM